MRKVEMVNRKLVSLESVLTEAEVVDRYPEMFVISDHEIEWGEREHTSMRLKVNWMYICMATITRK